ncbi:hypothetical protein WDZ92_49230, partial [Nostoc sp. NIES-2111]
MCGIVGLFLKDERLQPELGGMLASMLDVMCDRGPDSAGFAVYGDGTGGRVKLTLRGPAGTDFEAIAAGLREAAGGAVPVAVRDTHAVVSVPATREQAVRTALSISAPGIDVVGAGTRME